MEVTKSSFDPSVFVVIICDLSDTKSVETKLEIWLFWNQNLWDICLHLFLRSFKASSHLQLRLQPIVLDLSLSARANHWQGTVKSRPSTGDPDEGPADFCCWPRIFPPHLDTQITKKNMNSQVPHQLTSPSSTHKPLMKVLKVLISNCQIYPEKKKDWPTLGPPFPHIQSEPKKNGEPYFHSKWSFNVRILTNNCWVYERIPR